VEYSVRAARITDVERIIALSGVPLDAGDLLRQLVYLPHASVIVAEWRREIVGGAVLAIRPSIQAGGFVGVLDLLAVGAAHDADRVTELLLEEVVRSARNKGCAVVEAPQPADPAERTRWERLGFHDAGPLLERAVEPAGAAGRHAR
jgi:predicted N-acetyltransferase YhbS